MPLRHGCPWLLIAAFALATPAEAHDQQRPVVVIGVDGMTFDLIDPLVQAGQMPNTAALLQRGTKAILTSEKPMRSPALWTTLATGQPRSVHGIYDFVTGSGYWPRSKRAKKQTLVTSNMRRSPALWTWVGRAKKRSLVVGWLNTWPAEDIVGTMVAPYVALGTRRQTSIKGKIYTDAAQQFAPAAIEKTLRPLVVASDSVEAEQIASLIDEPPKGSKLYKAVPRLRRYLYTVRWSIASTITNTAMMEEQLRSKDYELAMTYFDGADTLAHRFWLMRQPVDEIATRLRHHNMDPAVAPELKQRFGKVLEGYYKLVDRMIGRLAAAAGEDATIFVISDHGWGSLPKGSKAPSSRVPFDGEHRLDGILIAAGPHIEHANVEPVTLYDLAPTILSLKGIVIPTELPGRVLEEMITPDFSTQHPSVLLAETPKSKTKTTETTAAPHSDTELERLRSLGYVQ